MRAEVYWISDAPARLAVLPRPRGGDYIEDEIASLAEQGVEVLVSLLIDEEVAALELTREAEVCAACSVHFFSLPIEDRGVPVSHRAVDALIQELCFSLRQGRGVGVHCRAGIGRSAMIAAAVLASLGVDVDKAFAMIAEARGCEVPDTAEQRDWVVEYASRMVRE